jgi:hypothetical protein
MWGSGIDLSAPDPGNELTVSRQMNRLDQIRIVVLDVPDARAHRPADHVVGSEGARSAFRSGTSAGSSPSHCGHASGFSRKRQQKRYH